MPPHCGHTLIDDSYPVGGSMRKVDDASTRMRTTVGDTHNNPLAVALVSNLYTTVP